MRKKETDGLGRNRIESVLANSIKGGGAPKEGNRVKKGDLQLGPIGPSCKAIKRGKGRDLGKEDVKDPRVEKGTNRNLGWLM